MGLSLGWWVAKVGRPAFVESLLADTATSLRVLVYLARRSVARQRGEVFDSIGIEVDSDVSPLFAALHDLWMLEPPRWRDVRPWWPDCPMSEQYRRDLVAAARTQGW